jgi:hypothetical protein
MMKVIGALLAAGGAAIWLLKRHQPAKPVPHERSIVVGPGTAGCRVARCPDNVEMRKGRRDTLTWQISNDSPPGSSCDRRVEVSIGEWKLEGQPVSPPVKAQGGGALRRTVSPRQRPVPLPVVIADEAERGKYSYGVLIDGVLADDPMLEIVL